MKFRIGIDVGGTNTDAVILGDAQDHPNSDTAIVAWEKSPTTANVTDGIAKALGAVIDTSKVSAKDIAYVSIGTTVGNLISVYCAFCSNTVAFHQCSDRSQSKQTGEGRSNSTRWTLY